MTLPAIPDSVSDLLAGLEDMANAEPGYLTAKQNFEGNAPEYFASRKIARKIADSGKKYRVNIAKKPVTSVVDRLEIAAISVPGSDTLTGRLRAEVWLPNELDLEAPIIHRKACEFGDEYVFLSEGEDEDGQPNGTPVIERSSAMSTRIIYDPESPRRPKYGIKAWEIGAGEKRRTRVNLYYPATDPGGCRVEKWITVEGSKGTDPDHWQPYLTRDEDGETDSESWTVELDRFPIYHFRTDRPYGTPLHFDAYGAQAAINKLTATMMATIDEQGYPTRWALTDAAAGEGSDDDDDFGDLDDDTAGVVDSEARATGRDSRLRNGPGEFWWLSASKTGQYTPADPDVFLKPADWLVRMASQATDTPLHMYDPGGDQPSGDSRRAALDTLVNKVRYLSLSFGATWRNLLRDALTIAGIEVDEVDVRWSPFDRIDDLEGWQTVQAKIDAGVPVAQALEEAGYTSEQVTDWLKASGGEQDMKRKVALLVDMAKASRDLGTAVGMGVVSNELVNEIMRSVVPSTTDSEA